MLGSTRFVTDSAGIVVQESIFTPFGSELLNAYNNGGKYSYRYATHESMNTETGLSYMQARYADPNIGRFISADPAQQGINYYIYSGNNPTTNIDPDGLLFETVYNLVNNIFSNKGTINNNISVPQSFYSYGQTQTDFGVQNYPSASTTTVRNIHNSSVDTRVDLNNGEESLAANEFNDKNIFNIKFNDFKLSSFKDAFTNVYREKIGATLNQFIRANDLINNVSDSLKNTPFKYNGMLMQAVKPALYPLVYTDILASDTAKGIGTTIGSILNFERMEAKNHVERIFENGYLKGNVAHLFDNQLLAYDTAYNVTAKVAEDPGAAAGWYTGQASYEGMRYLATLGAFKFAGGVANAVEFADFNKSLKTSSFNGNWNRKVSNFFGRRSLGADVRMPRTGVKGLIKDARLPFRGKIRYVPPKYVNANTGLPRAPGGGFIDKFGNVWVKGPSRTAGQLFEWDVQLSKTGKAKIGWLSIDGSHVNVSLDGHVTH